MREFLSGLRLAFPDDCDAPSQRPKIFDGLSISHDISIEFVLPELCPRLRNGCFFAAGVAMPKASVDEDNDTVLREHEIWRAREVMPMEPVAEPKSMSRSAYSYLCQGVFRPHLRHQPGPMLRRKAVHSALFGRVLNRHAALELFFDRPEDGPRHNGRHAVSDHPK